jgi:hypothetical protein
MNINKNEKQQNILLANKQLETDKDYFPYWYINITACKPLPAKPVSRQFSLANVSSNRASSSSLLGHTCLQRSLDSVRGEATVFVYIYKISLLLTYRSKSKVSFTLFYFVLFLVSYSTFNSIYNSFLQLSNVIIA